MLFGMFGGSSWPHLWFVSKTKAPDGGPLSCRPHRKLLTSLSFLSLSVISPVLWFWPFHILNCLVIPTCVLAVKPSEHHVLLTTDSRLFFFFKSLYFPAITCCGGRERWLKDVTFSSHWSFGVEEKEFARTEKSLTRKTGYYSLTHLFPVCLSLHHPAFLLSTCTIFIFLLSWNLNLTYRRAYI